MTSALTDRGSTRQWRAIRERILTRDRNTCRWCGKAANTVGHIVPRRMGGGDSPDNLGAQCWECQRREAPLPGRRGVGSLAVRGDYSVRRA